MRRLEWMFQAWLGGSLFHNPNLVWETTVYMEGVVRTFVVVGQCTPWWSWKLFEVLEGGDPWRPGWKAKMTVRLIAAYKIRYMYWTHLNIVWNVRVAVLQRLFVTSSRSWALPGRSYILRFGRLFLLVALLFSIFWRSLPRTSRTTVTSLGVMFPLSPWETMKSMMSSIFGSGRRYCPPRCWTSKCRTNECL